MLKLHGALRNPLLRKPDGHVSAFSQDYWHVCDVSHSSHRNPLLWKHLDHFNSLLLHNLWNRDIRDSGAVLQLWDLHGPQDILNHSELSRWLSLGVASQLTSAILHEDMISHSNGQSNHSVDDTLCAGPVGTPRSHARANLKHFRVALRRELRLRYLDSLRELLNGR